VRNSPAIGTEERLRCLPGQFEEQAGLRPGALAVVCGEERMMYGELNRKANQLARRLREEGVAPDERVAVLADRSANTVMGFLAVMKSGGAYVPIDPRLPAERIEHILRDAGCRVLLAHIRHLPGIAYAGAAIGLDDQTAYQGPDANLEVENSPDDIAYVIYTSGSTGRPKGVMIGHRSLANYVAQVRERFGLPEALNYGLVSTFAADLGNTALFPALATGGTLHVLGERDMTDPDGFARWLDEGRIDLIKITPSHFAALAGRNAKAAASLRWLVFGGESLSAELVTAVRRINPGCRIFNHYGPTETTVGAAAGEAALGEGAAVVPLGWPLGNAQIHILDAALQRMPPRLPGELCIAGEGVARGYLNQADLTAEKFVANPYGTGERLYRTGDVGRWRTDGTIDFLGRMDDQVKIRGHRVETAEIESVLRRHPGVAGAAVVARADLNGGEKTLCAYFVDGGVDAAALREYLRRKLPDYMMPSHLIRLPRIPLTENGKLDRASLPDPAPGEATRAYVAPRNSREERLAGAFARALGRAEIGIDDNFFELGGHSLKAVRVVGEVRQLLEVEVELKDVFAYPTVRSLAEIVGERARLGVEPIPAAEEREWYPASSAQRRMFALQELNPRTVAYNLSGIYRLEGEVDHGRVELAMRAVIRCHESLRTRFGLRDGEVMQTVEKDVDFALERVEDAKAGGRHFPDGFIRPFDLGRAPLLRAGLVKRPEGCFLCVDRHHIVSDEVSSRLLIRDFSRAYDGEPLAAPAVQYKDYAVWQQTRLAGEYGRRLEDYWLRRFGGEIPVLDLPADHPRPEVQRFEGARTTICLDESLDGEIAALCEREGVTRHMFLLAAYLILLSKLGGQEDVVVGLPVMGRDHPDLEEIVGMFVNTIALRSQPCGRKPILDYIGEVKQLVLEGIGHQEYPFEKLVEKVSVAGDLSRNPLFATMFVLADADLQPRRMSDAVFRTEEPEPSVAKFDLTVTVQTGEKGTAIWLDYATALFSPDTMVRLARRFERLVREMTAHPHRRLGEIDILDEAEKTRLLVTCNATAAVFPAESCLHELFEERAARKPEAVAVVCGRRRFSYRELNARANRLARRLRGEGVAADSLVGIWADQSADMVVGILGILKAGGAYVPIDPDQPDERIVRMLEQGGVGIMLAAEGSRARLRGAGSVLIDPDGAGAGADDAGDLVRGSGPQNLAYVIHTSGSTGAPKGVAIAHRSVVNLLGALSAAIPESAGVLERWAMLSSASFDASVKTLFLSLCGGGELHLIPRRLTLEPDRLACYLADNRIDACDGTPAYVGLLARAPAFQEDGGLKCLLVGGDLLEADAVREACRRASGGTGAVLLNLYGPTECCVDSTCAVLDGSSHRVTIGRPLANCRAYVLDRALRLACPGAAGELCIAGEGLARGYLRGPDLTAEKFVAHPYEGAGRLYRTGDLARWLPDGTLEFLGRMDSQVKIRGYRIEPGEIESAMREHPGVLAAAVAACSAGEDGGKSLSAFYVAEAGRVDGEALREGLRRKLPGYMIPSHFTRMDALPLTAHGKVDRAALPAPAPAGGETHEPPRGPLEERIAAIFAEVLGKEKIGRTDNFFELGGHSLKAIRAVARLRRGLEVGLQLGEFFRRPTVRALAEAVRARRRQKLEAIPSAGRRDWYPASSAQRRMFALRHLDAGTAYNMPAAYRLLGELDRRKVERALAAVVERHEVLRTRLALRDGAVMQQIEENVAFELGYAERDGADAGELLRDFVRPFDLGRPPLFRAMLVRRGPADHVLCVDMHHAVSDLASARLLLGDFTRAYRGECLPELPLQYKDYAAWQEGRLAGERGRQLAEYWLGRFAGEIPVLNLPADFARPAMQTFEGLREARRLDEDLSAQVRRFCEREGVTLFTFFLAAYQVLLARYCGQEDVVVGTPVLGRDRPEWEEMLGMFVNLLAVRGRPERGKGLGEYAREVQRLMLDDLEHQDYPFEELVGKLPLEKDLSRHPLFDTVFSLVEAEGGTEELEAIGARRVNTRATAARFDLTVSVQAGGSGIGVSFEYATRLFTAETIKRMWGHYERVVRHMARDPAMRIGEIELAGPEERAWLLRTFGETPAGFPQDRGVPELFEAQARLRPGAVAVSSGTRKLTFGELNATANRLARRLRREGAASESLVGILADRSWEMVVALLAVLKAGAAYMPIDPEHPRERIDYMLRDSRCALVLAQPRLEPLLAGHSAKTLLLEDAAMLTGDGTDLGVASREQGLMYVMYTSGSTGRPKGAMVTHGAVANHLLWAARTCAMDETDVILQKTTYTFDLSIWELFLGAVTGARLCLLPAGAEKDMGEVARTMREERVTTVVFVPSVLGMFLQELEDGASFPHLRRCLCCGEALAVEHKDSFFGKIGPGAALRNLYGPTETTIAVSDYAVRPEDRTIPIGTPVADTCLHAVDRELRLAPAGVPGELCVGGIQVARGYLNRPDLTAEKFVANPWGNGERMYRTGDRARCRADGNIEFLGRMDAQLKIRGHRIEPGEIEAVVRDHPGVRAAAVVARTLRGSGEKCLCAYYTPAEAGPGPDELREYARTRLPGYMVPAYFVPLDRLPSTPNGKLDRKRLPEPEPGSGPAGPVAPRDAMEAQLVEIFREVLGVDKVGIDDAFFELGGHSVKAIALVQRINRALSGDLSLVALLSHPTVRRLRRHLSAATAASSGQK